MSLVFKCWGRVSADIAPKQIRTKADKPMTIVQAYVPDDSEMGVGLTRGFVDGHNAVRCGEIVPMLVVADDVSLDIVTLDDAATKGFGPKPSSPSRAPGRPAK